ncbi:hypothetical protein DL98DRAFT_659049 [Cadophora sp. DSE1049]|nr:hypothetical protein DL98DRAFT_659049 [Cadophora sp. DSE1049]
MKFSPGNRRGDKFQPKPGYTGCITDSDTSAEIEGFSEESDEEPAEGKSLFTTVFTASEAEYDAREVMGQLEERKATHILESKIKKPAPNEAYTTQWTDRFFQGLLIDTGASNKNTGGINQLRALQRVQDVNFDISQAGRSRIIFGAGSRPFLGTATVDTPAGRIEFQIVDADILFLICLQQLDALNAQYDNLRNVLIQSKKKHLIMEGWVQRPTGADSDQ